MPLQYRWAQGVAAGESASAVRRGPREGAAKAPLLSVRHLRQQSDKSGALSYQEDKTIVMKDRVQLHARSRYGIRPVEMRAIAVASLDRQTSRRGVDIVIATGPLVASLYRQTSRRCRIRPAEERKQGASRSVRGMIALQAERAMEKNE